MASLLTMNYIVPKGSCSGYDGVSGCEQKTLHRQLSNKKTPFLRIQTGGGCEGLRSQNAVDSLHARPSRSGAKLTPRLAKREALNSRPSRPAVICGKGMSLVLVGAEMAPWSKTGALGDALGGLPAAMAANGHRVMAIAPRYDQYRDGWDTTVTIEITVGNRIETVRYFHCYKRGVDRVFIDHPWFLAKVWGKTEGKLYGPVAGVDYEDNQLRYSLLCKAALEAPRILNLKNSEQHYGPYGENVVFIANDWHAAPLPCYLKGLYQSHGIYKNAKVVFCIHNIVYQGRFAFSDLSLLNLPDSFRSSFDFTDGYDKPVKGRKINWMKAGIVESDRVVTVSPYYAQEIVSGKDRGVELDNTIRMTGITGIVNGMDVAEWDPSTDKYITANYDASTVMHGKPLNKEALQAELGLAIARDVPIIAFLGRLEEQRGSDILAAAIPEFIHENVQLIALGTGKKNMEVQLARLEEKYQEQIRVHFKFNVQLAHQIMAGADFLIIPSRFEPCGLTQFQGMRYGLPSICATTGGLVDTVKEGITGFHMGAFSVDCDVVDEEDVQKVVDNVKRALKVYRTPAFAVMIQNCMSQDFSWKGPAKKWEQVLLSLGVTGSEPGIEEEETSPLTSENVASP